MTWDDSKFVALDLETSGTLPEYALQPWRVAQKLAWITSVSVVHHDGARLKAQGKLFPKVPDIRRMLEEVVAKGQTVVGWNIVFDISWLIAIGLEDLAMRINWLDGMLLWRHYFIEPEYDMSRPNKKSYNLLAALTELTPAAAAYKTDVDYHSTDPAELAKLQKYNDRDTVFTWAFAKVFYNQLTERQLQTALIEAECLPLVAEANLKGLPIDMLATRELAQWLSDTAATKLAELAPHGVTEKIVRSPLQLSKLMFDDWGLPVLKENVSKLTGKTTRSTDKEVLHELAFQDLRAKQLREYREALNNRTKFADAPLVSADYNGDGRARPSAMVFSTYCVPGDVEVLTRQGWVALQAWSGGDIAQARPDWSIEFLPATRFVGPVVDMWCRVDHQRLQCDFTAGHTMPFIHTRTGAWQVVKAGEMRRSKAYDLPVAGRVSLDGAITPEQMRVLAAVQADGCFRAGGAVALTFEKVRKQQRMRELLDACGVPYNVHVSVTQPGREAIYIRGADRPGWLSPDRKEFGPWVLDTTAVGLAALVDEVRHWDGSAHKDGGHRYVSKTRENVEWVVTAAALVGCKAALHAVNADDMSSCHISDQRAVATVRPERHMTAQAGARRAFCATTQTGFWLARSKGHIFVTGNTGRMTVASKQGKNKDERQTGFALHQEKRGDQFRSIVIAPPGYTLMEFDAAGQEYRWMAIESGDPIMLDMCRLGEDAHSFMGANIVGRDYRELVAATKVKDETAVQHRYLGKFANLSCIAAGSPVLTDRGYVAIEEVTVSDRLWDGLEWVHHDGVISQGAKDVITYQGVTGTADHKVLLTTGAWCGLQEAADYGREIQSALGQGRACRAWAALRVVGGIVRRAVHSVRSPLRDGALPVRGHQGSQPAVCGDRSVGGLSRMCVSADAPQQRQAGRRYARQEAASEAGQRYEAAMSKPQRPRLPQLWWARDRVSLRLHQGWCGLYSLGAAVTVLRWLRSGPNQQQWPLRAGQPSTGYAQGQPVKQATFDLLNAGPRKRFSVGSRVVSNCQYRTGAKKLRAKARVEYLIPLELDEAKRIHRTYQLTYPKVPEFWRNQIALTRRLGYVENLVGRRVQVVGNWDGDMGWAMGSTAINYKIQSVGAEQKYLALKVLKPYLVSIGAQLAFELHDGLYLWVPNDKVARAAVDIKQLLDNLPYKEAWGFTPPIPLPWDAKSGGGWGSLKEWKYD